MTVFENLCSAEIVANILDDVSAVGVSRACRIAILDLVGEPVLHYLILLLQVEIAVWRRRWPPTAW